MRWCETLSQALNKNTSVSVSFLYWETSFKSYKRNFNYRSSTLAYFRWQFIRQIRGICSTCELDCFNDFPNCQWKSPWSKVILVLTGRPPIFAGVVRCLKFNGSHPLSSANCSCSFQVWDFKTSLSIFGDSSRLFNIFISNFVYLRLNISPCSGAVRHWDGK